MPLNAVQSHSLAMYPKPFITLTSLVPQRLVEVPETEPLDITSAIGSKAFKTPALRENVTCNLFHRRHSFFSLHLIALIACQIAPVFFGRFSFSIHSLGYGVITAFPVARFTLARLASTLIKTFV